MIKNKYIFLFFLLSNNIYAQTTCRVHKHGHQATVDNLKLLQNVLSPLLLGDCPETVTDEMTLLKENYIDHYKSSPIIKKELHGLQLQDHQLAIDALSVVLEDKPAKTITQASDCRTVVCVLEKLTGDEKAAYQVLDLYRDTGYALSLKQVSEQQTKYWSADQIDKAYQSMSKMPAQMKKLKGLTHLYVFEEKFQIDDYMREKGDKKGYEDAGGLASLTWKNGKPRGEIYFNASVFEHNHSWASETILHEIAHHFDYKAIVESTGSSQAQLAGFYELSGWKEIGAKWHIDKENACFITDYAQTNPKEHFAETISHFLSQPIALKMKCPAYYDFAKNQIFNGHDPLLQDKWDDFEEALAKHNPNLMECLDPKLQSYMHFQKNAYYQSAASGTGSFSTAYAPNIDQQCLVELLKPMRTDLIQENNYCEMGGMKKIVEMASQRLQATLDITMKENSKLAEENQLLQQLNQCLNEKTLTLECIQKQNSQNLLNAVNSNPDIAQWFGPDFATKQVEQISKKLSLYSNNDIASFTQKFETQLITGCLEGLNSITASKTSVNFGANYYSSTNPFILSECTQSGGKKLDATVDDEVMRLIYNQDHLSKKLEFISTKIILPYSQLKLTCRQDEKCRNTSLTKLIQAQPELKNMEMELVKIIAAKYRN
jgi:Mlc titration factor MtfA (ptsG expression regulator)